MNELPKTKTYDTYVVASALTGVALGPLSFVDLADVHSMLFGTPIWSHELVHIPTIDACSQEGYRQFHDMPTQELAESDWELARNNAEAAYGHFITVKRGTHGRRESPLTTAKNLTGKYPITF